MWSKQNIYSKTNGLKISRILKKHDLYKDPDIENLIKKTEKMLEHINKRKTKHDYKTMRKCLEKQAKLRKLRKYIAKKSS